MRCALITGLCMGAIFLSQQLAGHPQGGPQWQDTWPAVMAWLPILLFGPAAVFLRTSVRSIGSPNITVGRRALTCAAMGHIAASTLPAAAAAAATHRIGILVFTLTSLSRSNHLDRRPVLRGDSGGEGHR